MRTGPATVERTLSTVERDVRVLFKVNLLCVMENHQWKGLLCLLRSVIWVSLFAPGLWSAIWVSFFHSRSVVRVIPFSPWACQCFGWKMQVSGQWWQHAMVYMWHPRGITKSGGEVRTVSYCLRCVFRSSHGKDLMAACFVRVFVSVCPCVKLLYTVCVVCIFITKRWIGFNWYVVCSLCLAAGEI